MGRYPPHLPSLSSPFECGVHPVSPVCFTKTRINSFDEMPPATRNAGRAPFWWGSVANTGQGRNTAAARGHGVGLGTSRGARPGDLFEGGAAILVTAMRGRKSVVADSWRLDAYSPCGIEEPFEKLPKQTGRLGYFQSRGRLARVRVGSPVLKYAPQVTKLLGAFDLE